MDDADPDWHDRWTALFDVLGNKWAAHVLRALAEEPRGFNELRREVGTTAKVLSARLEELRCRGFVEREVHDTRPPTTTYRLTDGGERVTAGLRAVEREVDVTDCCGTGCATPRGARVDC